MFVWIRSLSFLILFIFVTPCFPRVDAISSSVASANSKLFLCWLLLHRQLSTQPTCDARSAQSLLASPGSESQPSSSQAGTQLTDCSQISAHASGAWRHPNTLVPNFYLVFLFWHLWMTHPLRARVNTCVNVAPNPCAQRKVLGLTKPKSKIYKTKSLRNYITLFRFHSFQDCSKLIN